MFILTERVARRKRQVIERIIMDLWGGCSLGGWKALEE